MKIVLILSSLFCFVLSYSQTDNQLYGDSLAIDSLAPDTANPLSIHPPRKATIMSAVLPGLGQAYNKQYWKMPIVYAGLGVSIYFIQDNTKNFKYFRSQLLAVVDGDPNTVNETQYNQTNLTEITEIYRRWRDWSYISTAAIYLLNVIDANVSAHLFFFDVSEDLSLRWSPVLLGGNSPKAGIGLQLQF